ncbi:hypothetical protein [Laspinema olomoucense]|uniref:Uncharacterized protein n=1 Tax=Laspinema olomoucense D3b TaxID=2953688 RepID=A0ABT2NFL4_9CYAN|nr:MULTISPECIES: hypothetical protein [unclassified Laspinema]MCT7981492.1 hypothetical protein [Laspinema sp. D3b]MCT7991983.1 hypothetical protein [Laspinema sp. D3a]MCT7997498.1 hypothetical protein [Laspinema sp. D3c]
MDSSSHTGFSNTRFPIAVRSPVLFSPVPSSPGFWEKQFQADCTLKESLQGRKSTDNLLTLTPIGDPLIFSALFCQD